MKFNYLTTKIPYLAVLTLLFSLASCGSYEYVGHDNDGVYGSDDRTVEYQTEKETEVQSTDNGVYYKNYFSEKSKDYETMTDNREVFTDIDSYQGEYDEEVIDTLQYEKAYAGWGQNNDDVTINIYNGGYNYWGYRPYYGSYWNYGWGYASFGLGYGYGYPYYGYGYGYPHYGYGYGYPYYYGNNYMYFQHNPYGYNYYYSGVHSRRNYAYNSGRRSSIYNNNLSTLSRRSSSANRLRSSTSRNNSRATTPRSSTPRTTTQPRSNTSRPRATTQPRSNTSRPRATTQPRSSTPRASTTRSSTPRASTSRSSSSMSRSSSSSSRSSGSSSSSSRSGRRN